MKPLHITHLRCEYLNNPLGIDVTRPRLSWQLESKRRGARQTAYQVIVSGNEVDLESEKELLWDSGKVESDQSVHIIYSGKRLQSAQRAWWKVRIWDEEGVPSAYSSPAWWEMGLLRPTDWQGKWIGGPLVGGTHTSVPSPFLRKRFRVEKPVVNARLYVTALGLYEMYLNGKWVAEDVFTPGWTDYRKRVQYQTYDVTHLLREGDQVMGALLGDGWYCGHVGWSTRQQYGQRPKLLAQLVIMLEDGSQEVVVTDETWKVAYGPILQSDLLMGESYDARLEFPDWGSNQFDDSAWFSVVCFDDPKVKLVAPKMLPVRRIQEIHPVGKPRECNRWPYRCWIFDFGQNMTGRLRLRVKGPAGTTIVMRHAEVLNPDGSLYTANLRAARQTDTYTLRGEGEEVYEPRFTFHGFRYVELTGFPGQADENTLTAIVLHTEMEPAGTFECSEPLLNQLQHNIVWGQKSNYLDVPTDCPQRDERLGWSGDAQVFSRTGAFNMDVAGFFTKWSQDLEDGQAGSGAYPPVAPWPNISNLQEDGGPAWADAGIIVPWTMYLCYGDTSILKERYRSMTRFVDYLVKSSPGYIRCHPEIKGFKGYGDWLSIRAETPKDLVGTAFFAYSLALMAKIAHVLGKSDDVEKYKRLHQEVRESFIKRFITPGGLVMGQTQTAYVLALWFDLLPGELRPRIVDELVQDIEQRQMHLSSGFVGTAYLPQTLSKEGRLDIAYALLNQKSWPSWLYPVTQGATTIWERWDGWTHDKGFQDPGMNSFNHYAFGCIGNWMYTVIGGIDIDPEVPGYKHIILRPRFGGGITSAKATYQSMYGEIISEWKIRGGKFDWEIAVPPNTSATVYVPAGEKASIFEGELPAHQAEGVTLTRRGKEMAIFEVQPGRYSFLVRE